MNLGLHVRVRIVLPVEDRHSECLQILVSVYTGIIVVLGLFKDRLRSMVGAKRNAAYVNFRINKIFQ